MNPFEDRVRAHDALVHEASVQKKMFRPNAKSLSRIEGMTVGDVRQCFSQMRACPALSSNTTLWCGVTAGEFALSYLVNTVGSSRKKRTQAGGTKDP